MKPLPTNPDIAIVRFSALGDIVHTLPAYTALRHHYPKSRITWFVHPLGARLLACVDGIDAIEVVNLKDGSIAQRLSELNRQRRQQHPDLVLDFQGLIKSAVFARLLGGERLGFAKVDLREPMAALFYTRQATAFSGQHVIDRNLHLLSLLDIPHPTMPAYSLRIPTPDPHTPAGERLHALVQILKHPVLINLGGNWPTKQYPADFWVKLIKNLSPDIEPLLIWGAPREEELAREIGQLCGTPSAPALDFPELLWLISRSRLMISADSLALHLCDALTVPSIGIFGPTDPARNGSRHPASRSIRADVSCGFCYRRSCDKMWCTLRLNPQEAASAANEVIEGHG